MVQWSSHQNFLPFSPPWTTLLLSKSQPVFSSTTLSLFSSFALSAAALGKPKNWILLGSMRLSLFLIYDSDLWFFFFDLWFFLSLLVCVCMCICVLLLFWSMRLSSFLIYDSFSLSLSLGVCVYVYMFPSSFLIYESFFVFDQWFWSMILSSFLIYDSFFVSDLWFFLLFWRF